MVKIITVIIVIILASLLLVFLFGDFTRTARESVSGTLGQTVTRYQTSVKDTKDNLEQNSQNAVNNTKETIYDKAQEVLDTVFNKQTSDEKVISINVLTADNISVGVDQKVYDIDLSKDANFKVTLSKNSKYYLKFQNVAPNSCLFIKDKRYEIGDNQIIEVQFSSTGTYAIKTNTCNLTDRNIGEIIVQ
ncbi:hypothetical protein HYS96_03350 [Candidatus Daviesbacteria bacterium]|nr:hypothetical protein [Candidatus Daviesbacteria bacterium]